MTLYALKPRFQRGLRPAVRRLAAAGVTANQVTVLAALLSVALGLALCVLPRAAFALLPLWLLLRMALNAVDGMLAREHGQQSRLGAYLNELGDVLSDAALALPLAFVAPFDPRWVAAFIFLGLLSEFAGVLGPARRYEGPLGKSDRALVLGALGLWIALSPELPGWLAGLMPLLCALLLLTTVNRVHQGLKATKGA
ncbi:CDP-alcohol phosphatidyltransferase family protein [Inhella proteolytica]|uniref:CDP-alcohol phosphatidyltransferase family protein n=1 Tax=Inhella proteolytica TaxID=2795029 RepID=A0A931NJS5_9BURK|nr:CDP-alcohol phosphatidyltransferase family protein [Inhella proteolytica]MBH9579289.1 CDP-alcohol phosphatidyltransferase family protein [Inhella proteolytica]